MTELQINPEISAVPQVPLDKLLIEMCRWGCPRVGKQRTGWLSTIEMTVNAVGATFDIRSDFEHATPLEAVQVCYSRMQASLKTLGVAA